MAGEPDRHLRSRVGVDIEIQEQIVAVHVLSDLTSRERAVIVELEGIIAAACYRVDGRHIDPVAGLESINPIARSRGDSGIAKRSKYEAVGSGSSVQRVEAPPTDQSIIAAVADEPVITAAAGEHVSAGAAFDDIVAAQTQHHIL